MYKERGLSGVAVLTDNTLIMSQSDLQTSVAPPATEASVDTTPTTSRPDSAKSETLVDEGKVEPAKVVSEVATATFSKTTKWTLLGLFSLGLFIDV